MYLTKRRRLNDLRPLSLESVASLAAAWEVRMIFESNSIEGNSLTLRETELVLSKGVTVSGKPLKDHIETANLAKAWDELKNLAQPEAEFSEKNLLDLHSFILASIAPKYAGVYRTSTARIANSNRIPPHPLKVPELMTELFQKVSQTKDPVVQAAKIHHGISAIHPFSDGNGRAARLAMNFILLSAGYPPISIPTDLRLAYYDALEAADRGDFATWQNFSNQQLDRELDLYLDALDPTISS